MGLIRVRPSEADDKPFIVEMARMACTIEDRPLPPRDAGEVVSMLPGPGDCALIAVTDDGDRLGAAWWWFRQPPLLHDESGQAIPELAMAIVEDARGNGIGTSLIEMLVAEAAKRFSHLSLNVHIRNPAVRLYTRVGFDVAGAGRGRFGVAMRRTLDT